MGKSVHRSKKNSVLPDNKQEIEKLLEKSPEIKELWVRLSELAIASESSLKKYWLNSE